MMNERYRDCLETIDGFQGVSAATALVVEIASRDNLWLGWGIRPLITFETDRLKETVLTKRPHEVVTALRLADHGIRADFVADVVRKFNPIDGKMMQVGLADLANGYEIKSLSTASTFSTIDGYLRRAAKKRDARAIVFDNSDNDSLDDEGLFGFISKGRRRFSGRIYVLCKDGAYRRRA